MSPAVLFVAVAVAYAVGARLAFELAEASGLRAVFFIPAGITFAVVASVPRGRWGVVLAAAGSAELVSDLTMDLSFGSSLGFAIANTAGPLAGVLVMERMVGERIDLAEREHLAAFVVGGVVIGPAVAATVGATTGRPGGGGEWWTTAWQWWLGDSLAVLVVGGLLLALSGAPDRRPLASPAGIVLLSAGVVATAATLAASDLPLEFLGMATIVVAGGAFGVRAACASAVAVATTLAVGLAGGFGSAWFVDDDALPVVKAELGVFALLGLGVAAEAHRHATETRAHSDLESRWRADQTMRSVFDSLDDGFAIAEMVVDDTGVPVDYRFLHVNPLFGEHTGLRDAAGRTAHELVPGLEPHWVETYARVGLGGETLRFEQGSEVMGRWFDVFATPVEPKGRFAIVFRDRTEQREILLALERSEQRFRELADRLPLVVWQHDADGVRQFVNLTFCEYFGVSREEMDEGRWEMLTHPDDGTTYAEDFAEAVRQRTEFHGQVRVRRGDGAWRWMESWGRPVFDESGTHVGHVGASADVTERVEAEHRVISLLQVEQRRRREAQLLEQMAASLASAVTVDQIGEIVVEALTRLMVGTSTMAMARGERLVTIAASDDELLELGPIPVDASLPGARAYRSQHPVVLEDRSAIVDADPTLAPLAERTALGSLVAHPLVTGTGQVIGVLTVVGADDELLQDDRRSLVSTVAAQAAGALERARLHEADARERDREARRRERAELLAAVAPEIQTAVGEQERAQRLVDLLVPRFADFATVEVPGRDDPLVAVAHTDPDGHVVLERLRREFRLGPDEARSIARVARGETHHIATVTDTIRSEHAANEELGRLLSRLGQRSHLAVPLALGPGVSAALLLGVADPDRARFTRADANFMEGFAERAGLLLVAASVQERERQISLRLQDALLPDGLVSGPLLDTAARYEAAASSLNVGGDWYDSFDFGDGRIGLIVGDVVGHGLEAAAAMGRLRTAVSALAARTGPDPGAVLSALDEFARGPDGVRFATACYVVIDVVSGTCAYSSAGHPPALLVRHDGSTRWLDDVRSVPICALEVGERPAGLVDLAAGDLLVLYSDGLVERPGEALDRGLERLAASAGTTSGMSAAQITDRLVAELASGDEVDDDVVVVVARAVPGGWGRGRDSDVQDGAG